MEIRVVCIECGEDLDIQKVCVSDKTLNVDVEVEPCEVCAEREYNVGKEDGIDSCNEQD